jgi:DNA-binding transcriptional MocR family regulator
MESKKTSKKSLKAKWIRELTLIAGTRELLTKRQIADIIGVTISTITDAMNYGKIKHYVKLGPEKSKHPVFIPLWAAIEFVEGFKEEILPVQLMLPFQEFNKKK